MRSKVHQKNMSQESALNFNQWETLSENYKVIGVFVYKITELISSSSFKLKRGILPPLRK